jgi:hypothetical protein
MQCKRFFAAGRGKDFISLLLQIELQRPGKVQLVFDKQNFELPQFCSRIVQSQFSG